VRAHSGNGPRERRHAHNGTPLTREAIIPLLRDAALYTSFALSETGRSVRLNRIDGVTSDDNTDTVSVLTGNGDGTFQDKVEYPAGWVARSVAAVDVNHDGHPDLMVMNAFAKTVRILLATCLR
jgi:hypothetical protein